MTGPWGKPLDVSGPPAPASESEPATGPGFGTRPTPDAGPGFGTRPTPDTGPGFGTRPAPATGPGFGTRQEPSPGPTPRPDELPDPDDLPEPEPSPPSPGPPPTPPGTWGDDPADINLRPSWLRDRAEDCETALRSLGGTVSMAEAAFIRLLSVAPGWEFLGSLDDMRGRWEDINRVLRERLESAADNFRYSADRYEEAESANAQAFRAYSGGGGGTPW